MFSVGSVCQSFCPHGWGFHVIITYEAIQAPNLCTGSQPTPTLYRHGLVQLGPHHTAPRTDCWKAGGCHLTEKPSCVFTVHNKVAKVMFLHVCVCPQGGVPGNVPRGTRYTPRDQVHPPPETATVVDGTHPTGMHSCCR